MAEDGTILIGKSATQKTAATSRRVPWTGEEYKKHLELQAQADFLWGKMTQTINALAKHYGFDKKSV